MTRGDVAMILVCLALAIVVLSRVELKRARRRRHGGAIEPDYYPPPPPATRERPKLRVVGRGKEER